MSRRLFVLTAVWVWVAAAAGVPHAAGPQGTSPGPSVDASTPRAVLNRYCVTCHNERLKTGGLALDGIDIDHVSRAPEVWEKVIRKLRTGSMPPQPAPRPDQAVSDRLLTWLETAIDRAASAAPNPGRPLLHRLNRAEYANAIRDLLALNVSVASLLPPDDAAYGFDNISDVLGTSPLLLERYLAAAGRISALAVGDPDIGPGSDTYRVRQDLSQDQRIEGLPLGTVGGILVDHPFPLDAEYAFQVTLFRNNVDAIRGLGSPHQVEIAVDGKRILLATIGGATGREAGDAVEARLRVRVPVPAGPHTVSAAFIHKIGVGSDRLQPFLRSSIDTFDAGGRPHIETLTITGPFNATGSGDTPSRRRIFGCRPAGTAAEKPCALHIISTLARRAYRRALTREDVQPLLEFYDVGRRKGTFDGGIQMALRRILASPKFVFRGERDPERPAAGTVHPLSDVELASRLSFFLWSSIPDDELLAAADAGRLQDDAVLTRQVRRMLADPKAQSLVSNFASQWLHLRNLQSLIPNSNEFPDFDDNLRQAFRREAELFFASIIQEDRSVLDLMTADYTFVNERLARHYGMPNIFGTHFRRVTVSDVRKGLLGKGAILMVTSHADRTAPVVRGKWILENLVGAPPPPPPADVPPLKENEAGGAPRSMREQMEAHRANPVCAGCHKVMDPLGFALEHFDAVGAWRTLDAGVPIDASGQLTDGTTVDGVAMLRQALVKRPEAFVSTHTEKLLTYALGRGVTYADMPAVRRIVRESAREDYRFSSLILGIVKSAPFRMRRAQEVKDH